MTFKQGLLALTLCCSVFSTSYATEPNKGKEADAMDMIAMGMNDILNDYNDLTEDEYRQRIESLSNEISFRIDPLIKDRIELRLERAKTSTEATLGKAEIYFPIFEEHLAKYDVPHLIKYLAIIESNLEPLARSHAGAGGLWQFMPSTGRMYNMQITTTVDERSDTYKASESAAKLLAHLKNYHGDWCLALASYNCGAGRVNKAIKSAGTTDYWVVRNYLPTETQKYVPYFMAMVYVGEFAAMHGLTPTPHHKDYVLTDTIHYFGSTTLAQLAKEVGVGVDTLRFLNPSYLKNYIPRSTETHIIVLPARVVAELRGYEAQWNYLNNFQTENPMRAVRRIMKQEDLAWLAKAFRCTVKDLYTWNGLPEHYQVKAGDLIAIRKNNATRDQQQFAARRPSLKQNETIILPALQVVALQNNKAITMVSNDLPKLTNKTPLTAVLNQNNNSSNNNALAATSKKEATIPTVAVPTATTTPAAVNVKPSAMTAAIQEGDVAVSRDRSRNLKGRANLPAVAVEPTVAISSKPEVKTVEVKTVENTNNSKATVIEPVISAPTVVSNAQKLDENANPRGRNLRQASVAVPTGTIVTTTTKEVVTEERAGQKNHCVKPNETLWDILRDNPNVTSVEVLQINKLNRATDLYPGMIIKIPVR
jgi:membrane-bound lytic murein transglycosylase D